MKKIIVITVAIFVWDAVFSEIVLFDDPVLEQDVCGVLGINPPVTTEDILDLFLLETSDGIFSLRGLEHAVILDNLTSKNGTIQDLTPLSGLSKLGILDLTNQHISDLSPLSSLPLVLLDMTSNFISDISPLAETSTLIVLDLSSNQISDIGPLSSLPLVLLDVTSNFISDLSSLAEMPTLEVLGLSGNQIQDISPLANLTSLKGLYLNENPLNADAYSTYIPQIIANNPGIKIYYDPIPEPASLFVLIGGVFLLRRNKRV